MKIAVLGLGYVGVTAAACLASRGHTVIGIDPSEAKVKTVMAGLSPISEPGLPELIAEARSGGRLTAQTAVSAEVAEAELAIVCVGTPSAPDGSHDMSYIAEVSRQLAELVRDTESTLTVAYRSTVRPGTMEEVISPLFDAVLADSPGRVELVYNPEFLRESSAISDFFAPPKIVIGTKDGLPNREMTVINEGIDAPTFTVGFKESEVTKLVDNTFHAVKTSFANEIGRVCVSLGISATTVHEIFIADTKLNISPYYLRPGGAFGGSCLPKDVRALQYISRQANGRTHMIDALLDSNQAHKEFLFEQAAAGLDHGARILMLGIAFKNKTDDLRESPNVDVARMLLTAGFALSIHDPYVEPESLMGQNLGAMSRSPFIRDLLIGREAAESTNWDLVIDNRSVAADFNLTASRILDVNRLK